MGYNFSNKKDSISKGKLVNFHQSKDAFGQFKLTDFGLSELSFEGDSNKSSSKRGTKSYNAPEIFDSERKKLL